MRLQRNTGRVKITGTVEYGQLGKGSFSAEKSSQPSRDEGTVLLHFLRNVKLQLPPPPIARHRPQCNIPVSVTTVSSFTGKNSPAFPAAGNVTSPQTTPQVRPPLRPTPSPRRRSSVPPTEKAKLCRLAHVSPTRDPASPPNCLLHPKRRPRNRLTGSACPNRRHGALHSNIISTRTPPRMRTPCLRVPARNTQRHAPLRSSDLHPAAACCLQPFFFQPAIQNIENPVPDQISSQHSAVKQHVRRSRQSALAAPHAPCSACAACCRRKRPDAG